jgi:hypothetical protein
MKDPMERTVHVSRYCFSKNRWSTIDKPFKDRRKLTEAFDISLTTTKESCSLSLIDKDKAVYVHSNKA